VIGDDREAQSRFAELMAIARGAELENAERNNVQLEHTALWRVQVLMDRPLGAPVDLRLPRYASAISPPYPS
jgi:hypothetical protein